MDNENNQNIWNLNIEEERNFWSTKIIGTIIQMPELCIHCRIGKICLRKNKSYVNPYLGKCNHYKCNKEYFLLKGSLFETLNITLASLIYNILDLWLNDEFNGLKSLINLLIYIKLINVI